jgi:hypothetical protein
MAKLEDFTWLDETYMVNTRNVAFFKIEEDGRLRIVISGVPQEYSAITVETEKAGPIIEFLKKSHPDLVPKSKPAVKTPHCPAPTRGGPGSWMGD